MILIISSDDTRILRQLEVCHVGVLSVVYLAITHYVGNHVQRAPTSFRLNLGVFWSCPRSSVVLTSQTYINGTEVNLRY